jgi:excisionase family DNA binding protein
MTAQAYYRAREMAVLFGVTVRTVRRRIADGTLPSIRIGGARLVAKADLERLVGTSLDLPEEAEEEESTPSILSGC